MSENFTPEGIQERLTRAVRAKGNLAERSRQLGQQLEDFRRREHSQDHVTSELLERQRELNYMLHRASSVLHQLQDTNLALSAEFTHIVKELPAPKEKESEWDDTISRVNDLFHKTHELAGEMQDEILRATSQPEIPKMQVEEVAAPVSDSQAVTEAETAPPEEEARQPEPEQAVQPAPADESPAPKAEARAANPKGKPSKADDVFGRLDAYESGEAASGGKPRKRGILMRMFDWLNRD